MTAASHSLTLPWPVIAVILGLLGWRLIDLRFGILTTRRARNLLDHGPCGPRP